MHWTSYAWIENGILVAVTSPPCLIYTSASMCHQIHPQACEGGFFPTINIIYILYIRDALKIYSVHLYICAVIICKDTHWHNGFLKLVHVVNISSYLNAFYIMDRIRLCRKDSFCCIIIIKSFSITPATWAWFLGTRTRIFWSVTPLIYIYMVES